MTQRLQPVIDLNYGEQEVLQRVLAEPQKIANALAPDDARENSRIVGVLQELAEAFAEVFCGDCPACYFYRIVFYELFGS